MRFRVTASALLLLVAVACGGGGSEGQESGGTQFSIPPEETAENHLPVLLEGKIFAPTTAVFRGEEIPLSIDPFDPDGDPLEITWEASGGRLDPPDRRETRWHAPTTPGTYTIRATISDPHGEQASASIVVTVLGRGRTLDTAPWISYLPDEILSTPLPGIAGYAFDASREEADLTGFWIVVPGSGDLAAEIDADIERIRVALAPIARADADPTGTLASTTADGRPTSRRSLAVESPQPRFVREVRNAAFSALAPAFSPPDPSPARTPDTKFLLHLFEGFDPESATFMKLVVVTREALLDATGGTMADLTDASGVVATPAKIASVRVKRHPELTIVATDFLWVVDNSGSMEEEQSFVARNAALFCEILENFGFDFRIGVITTDSARLRGTFTDDCAAFSENVQVGIGGSGYEQGFLFAHRALDPTSPERLDFREDAAITVVFLSDEDDQSTTPEGQLIETDFYIDFFNALSVRTFAFVDLSTGSIPVCPTAEVPGKRYVAVARGTEGGEASICEPDATDSLTRIAQTAGRTSPDYSLPRATAPITASFIVTLDGEPLRGGRDYHFDRATSILRFDDEVVPPVGSVVAIEFATFVPLGSAGKGRKRE